MNELNTIKQFFTAIGCRFQCYDMGRLIQPIEHQTFIDFEHTRIAWNSPFMQHAWLALIFWKQISETSTEQNHTVWFLKLPLDEQAKLNLAARDDFLRRLIGALTNFLENSLQQQDNNQGEDLHSLDNVMKDNPYGFQPKQEQMANFHAIVHKHLALPASQYYQPAQKYFSGIDGFEHWSQLGFQGIADVAARMDEKYQGKNNQQLIAQAIAHLPASPFQALGNCLENHIVSRQLTRAVLDRVIRDQEREQNEKEPISIAIYIACIRATAQASDLNLQAQLLTRILSSSARSDLEILATISARCWQQLCQAQILSLFLEALARTEAYQNQGQGAFNAIMSDLMFIPEMRHTILQAFRSSERSERLAQAIGTFLNQIG